MLKRDELKDPSSCMNRANEEETVFVLLGRDPAAPVAIRAWIQERVRLGENTLNDPQITDAYTCIVQMIADGSAADGSVANG